MPVRMARPGASLLVVLLLVVVSLLPSATRAYVDLFLDSNETSTLLG